MADVRVEGPTVERGEEILTPEALEFVADLPTRFGVHRDALLAARATRRGEVAGAGRIDFREDAATAEISRSQVWQWVHAGVELDRRDDARRLFEQVALADEFPDFLTLPAYELID